CEATWTGRSAVLVTESFTVGRPALRMISPSWVMISPGIMGGAVHSENPLRLRERAASEASRVRGGLLSLDVVKEPLTRLGPAVLGTLSRKRRGKRSPDRVVHGHELGAVRKRGLDLDVVDHFGNAVHHL